MGHSKEARLLGEKKQEMGGEKNRAQETWEEDEGAGCPLVRVLE